MSAIRAKFLHGLLAIIVVASVWSVTNRTEAADDGIRPNIVFLLADDLGWTGLKCFGSDFYETPHLDRLAATGVRFTQAYSACTVCSPTRASIMTGIYPARLRLTDFIPGQHRPWARLNVPDWTKYLEHRYVTVAEALQAAGYTTLHVGKWHLDLRKRAGDYSPRSHGFDHQVLKPRAARGYRLPVGYNATGESKSDYLTDYLTDRALQLIDEVKDGPPFFLYFAYHTPHTPIQGREDLVEQFRGKSRPAAVHNNPVYAAMVASLDQSVGRILARLERHGLADRTVVVFTSDNGGLTQRYGKHDGFTDNKPLRRGKGSAYEGGVRVPTIVRWPSITAAGEQCSDPIMSIDFYPTILEAADAPYDSTSVDGVSVVPLLRDPSSSLRRQLFWHFPHYHAGGDSPYSAIRSGPWRLIEFHEDRKVELYHLDEDLGETNNLADQIPERAEMLLAELHSWRQSLSAQMPVANPDHDPQRETQVRRP